MVGIMRSRSNDIKGPSGVSGRLRPLTAHRTERHQANRNALNGHTPWSRRTKKTERSGADLVHLSERWFLRRIG
jgi:hypothetical protein